MSRGFTFIELMVSVLIFALVIIGIYYFFDEGQWLYLQSERKSRIQEMGRIAIEQMERDFRMIGAGVPSGVSDDGLSWRTPTPVIFNATVCTIAFTADIDNGTDDVSQNVGTDGDDHIFIGENTGNDYYISRATGTDINPDLQIVLVQDGHDWEDLIATSLGSDNTALVTTVDVTNPGNFPAAESTVHTLERVFYRLINQNGTVDANGVCDDLVAPYCTLQRQEYPTNNPAEIDPESESANRSWENLAKNVVSLQLSYLDVAGAEVVNPADALKIGIVLTVRDRSRSQARPTAFQQDIVLRSQVLIRNERL